MCHLASVVGFLLTTKIYNLDRMVHEGRHKQFQGSYEGEHRICPRRRATS